MSSVIAQINAKYMKKAIVDVKSGDTVRVHQKIREGSKERIQVFEGLVILTHRKGSHTASITVRRISSGVGVEKTYLLHSPLVMKVEVVKRSKVRRNYLSYMRARTGKSARLSGVSFDKEAVNAVHDEKAEAEEEKIHEKLEAEHEAGSAKELHEAGSAKELHEAGSAKAPKEDAKEETKAE